MLENLRRGRKKYGLSRYLLRQAKNHVNRYRYKLNRKRIVQAFRELGMQDGMTVCVHASLSRLGYIEGGADAVVDSLFEVLGEHGCIVMPTFSMIGTMRGYLDAGNVFDVRSTPSQVGAVAEAFRMRQGVLRSLHPTNSVAAYGSEAAELLRDHDLSQTPYGPDTPYGRLAENENAYILMLNTHVQSLLHHVQDRVEFPNMFFDTPTEASYIDHEGVSKTLATKVMRPLIPYYVAIPPASGKEPDWALLHDFSLIFPSRRDGELARFGYRLDRLPSLYNRRERLIAEGVLSSRKLGRGEIGLLNAARFVREVQPEFEQSIDSFRPYYDLEYLEAANLPPFV